MGWLALVDRRIRVDRLALVDRRIRLGWLVERDGLGLVGRRLGLERRRPRFGRYKLGIWRPRRHRHRRCLRHGLGRRSELSGLSWDSGLS
jgi:hypothetical protein